MKPLTIAVYGNTVEVAAVHGNCEAKTLEMKTVPELSFELNIPPSALRAIEEKRIPVKKVGRN